MFAVADEDGADEEKLSGDGELLPSAEMAETEEGEMAWRERGGEARA